MNANWMCQSPSAAFLGAERVLDTEKHLLQVFSVLPLISRQEAQPFSLVQHVQETCHVSETDPNFNNYTCLNNCCLYPALLCHGGKVAERALRVF